MSNTADSSYTPDFARIYLKLLIFDSTIHYIELLPKNLIQQHFKTQQKLFQIKLILQENITNLYLESNKPTNSLEVANLRYFIETINQQINSISYISVRNLKSKNKSNSPFSSPVKLSSSDIKYITDIFNEFHEISLDLSKADIFYTSKFTQILQNNFKLIFKHSKVTNLEHLIVLLDLVNVTLITATKNIEEDISIKALISATTDQIINILLQFGSRCR